MSFFAELKRRNVIRMAGLYLVGAWLLVQVAGTVLPMFDVPEWVARAIVILLALGFLPALVFAWVFELTPEGLKRDHEMTPEQSLASATGRRMDRLLLIAAMAVIAVLILERIWPAPGSESISGATASLSAEPAGPEIDSDPDSAAPTAPQSAASIAVLPFVNMSTDAENGYFADGISEELLNVLAGIEGLTVASRTSSFSFKGKELPIPEIARALGVQHVLEGSVRKQGQRVRITAQLIRAGTDTHLWSETYDRDLTDIFEVQEEIAQAISNELVDLLPLAPKVAVPSTTHNLEAYERFLRGRSRFYQRGELAEGLKDLQFAVERDPDFGEAWVFLAATHYVLPGYDLSVSTETGYDGARQALVHAHRLSPDHPMASALEGMIEADQGDYPRGLKALERAAALRSTDSTPAMWFGLLLLQSGYVHEAVSALEYAQRIDPLSGINNGYLGIALLCTGEESRGAAAVARAAELGWPAGTGLYAIELASRGDHRMARELAVPGEFDDPRFRREVAAFRAALDDPAKVGDFLAVLDPGQTDESLLALGMHDAFLDRWLGQIGADGNFGGSKWTLRSVWMPSSGGPAREDPRFFEIARRGGLVKLWESRGYPPGCSRVESDAGDRLACPGMKR